MSYSGVLCDVQLLGHLLHQILDHVDIGYLGVIKVVFDLVQILLRQALIAFVLRQLIRLFSVQEHTVFVAIHAETILVLYAWH